MNRLLICLTLLTVVDVAISGVYLTTCARMDVPLLKDVANEACKTSCGFKGCGSGYCTKRRGRKTCFCRGCR
ncbi:hypothetical protein ANCDUO_09232 [Ancylostoma duodenale]|uniref:Antibacterial peptide-6 n=1 Tax=Ancylostoma duodenale TaxID=51022 RepID=A0A0C2GTM9_9BILA|nr:antibacterial peptide-6 [Ancylostoma duodenale]KIH60516.1 hypothetical protein ANCDUO_09232 [Ancylostoma duodenale]